MDADEVRDVAVEVERLVDDAGRFVEEATRRRTSLHRSSVDDETVLEDAPAVDETRLLEDDAGVERTVTFLNDLVERRGLSRGDAWVCACRALSRVVERCERETRKRRRDDEAPRTTTTTTARDVDILRSIRRAVLVVGKLFRHHEEVEGAARVGETLRVLERCGEENAYVKMAPFEILDACERVLIPYLRTPMGRAIAARLVCVEMESLRAFRCGRGGGAFWLSPRMVPARFVTAVVAFGCSSKMKEILADYAHACVKAMVRRDGRVSSASARDAAATFTKDVNDMLAIFTPQGEDEFVSSMLVRESENTRIHEYQSVFQLEDQCQIHLRARAWLMSYALGRRDDLDRVRLRDLHRAFARDDEMIGEYLFWIATTHLDDTDRIVDALRVVYEEIDLDLGAHLCEEILDDAIDGSWFALYLHEIADVVRALETTLDADQESSDASASPATQRSRDGRASLGDLARRHRALERLASNQCA